MSKETLAEAGYEYVRHDSALGGHVLKELSSGNLELWFANKNHPSYGIIWRNTHLEFARSLPAGEGVRK